MSQENSKNKIEKFKKFNLHCGRLSLLLLIFSVVTMIISIALPMVGLQFSVASASAGKPLFITTLVINILFALFSIPWFVFTILSMVFSFKAKPKVKPVPTLICSIISANFVAAGLILVICGSIYALIFTTVPEMTTELFTTASILICVFGVIGGSLNIFSSLMQTIVCRKNQNVF